MATELSEEKSRTVTWKELKCIRIRADIERIGKDGKKVEGVCLRLGGDDIPEEVSSILEGIQKLLDE